MTEVVKMYSKKYVSELVRKNIKKYRLICGYSLQELADKAGYTHGYIRDLESLKVDKTPTLETLANIANALEIKMIQLFEE